MSNEAQLWAVARVMSGAEFEAAAEERALAGRCGNPLCSERPFQQRQQQQPGGHYRISLAEKAVYEKAGADPGEAAPPSDTCCNAACAAAVADFAARLGSGGAALARFEALLELVRAQDRAERLAAENAAAAAAATAPAPAPSAATAAPTAAQFADFSSGDSGSSKSGGGGGSSSCSSSGAAADGAAATAAARPRGVLKKGPARSRFAAGSHKVPIMLAEVKERDAHMVVEDTAANLPDDGSGSGSGGAGNPRAAAVEGYVPRARPPSIFGRAGAGGGHQQGSGGVAPEGEARARRVRFSDEAVAADEERQRREEAQERAAQLRRQAAGARSQPAALSRTSPPPKPVPAAQATPAYFVLDVEDAEGPLEGVRHGLAAQFGRLRLAEPEEAAAAVAATAALGGPAVDGGPAAVAGAALATLPRSAASDPSLASCADMSGAARPPSRSASGSALAPASRSAAVAGGRSGLDAPGGAPVAEVRYDAPQWQPSPTPSPSASASNLLAAAVVEDGGGPAHAAAAAARLGAAGPGCSGNAAAAAEGRAGQQQQQQQQREQGGSEGEAHPHPQQHRMLHQLFPALPLSAAAAAAAAGAGVPQPDTSSGAAPGGAGAAGRTASGGGSGPSFGPKLPSQLEALLAEQGCGVDVESEEEGERGLRSGQERAAAATVARSGRGSR